MEITFDSIINLFGLFIGGGSIVSLVTWKIARRKAVAEAKQAEAVATQAEAEAKKAEAEALQEKQNYYQQIIDDLVKDRDYYKTDRDEQRDRLDKLTSSVMEWKQISEDERMKMKNDINMLRRQIDCIRPLLCGKEGCLLRVPVDVNEDVLARTAGKREIEPIGMKDM